MIFTSINIRMKHTFTLQILLAAIAVAIAVKSEENGFLRANCGGSATADSSSLIFPISPDGDYLLPGEACIWTIHLETTRSFRFTLTNFSDNSTSDDCSDAGLRIYSLTNLSPEDKLQSYTFCSAKPPADDFFLNENVAVIVLYASGNSSSPIQFNQFDLMWEGSSFDPFQTKHVTSFSSASSGVIRYPAIGQYEPSLAATWVVNSESDQNPFRTDFALERLGLQSCANPDPCVCDALILYTISSSGVLEETQRFCSDSTDITIPEVKSRFILGFFTDFQTQSDTGSGFQVVYYPSEPPTTTTTPSTTTEVVTSTTPDLTMTQCGEVFTSRFGNITYKDTSTYDPNERCVWILRVPGAIRYDFSFITIDFTGQPADGIAISTFIRDQYPTHSYQQIRSPGKVQMSGSMALVLLLSDASVQKSGVFFTYEAIISTNDVSEDSRDVFLTGIPTDQVIHPDSGTDYFSQELSTFLVIPEFQHHPTSTITTTISLNGLDSTCNCCDLLVVYEFNNVGGSYWSLLKMLCNSSEDFTVDHTDLLLIIFVSDETTASQGGFNISTRIQ